MTEVTDLGEEVMVMARELVESAWSLSAQQKQVAQLLLLAAYVGSRRGSTRLPLEGGVKGPLGRLLAEIIPVCKLDLPVSAVLREGKKLIDEQSLDALFGRPGEYRPLIIDGGHIYLHKFHRAEEEVARALRARLSQSLSLGNAAEVVPALIAESSPPLSPEQAEVLSIAADRALSVVTGGPGTGKTFVIQSVVRLLQKLGLNSRDIALAAPTGKAAQRMADAVARVITEDPPVAQTLHRLLGYNPGDQRFRHHENNPLRCRALIIDEASMIDLPLMERLLRALSADTALLLLGDAHQLPSVDAGSILRDLVEVGVEHPRPFVVRLTRNYRMADAGADSPEPAAAAVMAGDPEPLLARNMVVGGEAGPILREHAVRFAHQARLAAQPSDENLSRLFAEHEQSRILTALRRGPHGSEGINAEIGRALGFHQPLAPGFPVIVRKNDYERELHNGDPGVIVGGRGSAMTVAFRTTGGFRQLPLRAVEHLIDPAFALTVHQSQGSEFDEVILILPPRDTPLLTRELVYTAITRAKRRASIIAQVDVLRCAVKRSTERFSALRERLRSV